MYGYEEDQTYGSYVPAYQLNMPSAPAVPSMAPAPSAPNPYPSAPNPYIAAAGLGLGGIGTLLGAYGSYKQSQAMDRQADLAEENFNLQKTLAFQDREASEEERRRMAMLQGGQYAQGMQDRSLGRYGEYVRRTGG